MNSKTYAILLGILSFFIFETADAATPLIVISKPSAEAIIKHPDPLASVTAKQFLALTPKKYEQLTGKKMNLVAKLQLKLVQHKIKKMVRNNEVVTMADVEKKFQDVSTMNVIGFLLGLILGPIGVIIVLILKETGDMGPDSLRWSLYGLLIWLAIVLLWFVIF